MIIKIEDAPSIKNIKIDINFEDGTSIVQSSESTTESNKPTTETQDEILLNLEEKFEVDQEIIDKPEIPDIDRNVSVSDDMKNAEY